MKSKTEFIARVQRLKNGFASKTGKAAYSNVSLIDKNIHFTRVNTGQPWRMNLDIIYNVYKNEDRIDTTTFKRYIKWRTNSPAVGLLIATQLIDKDGNRI